MKLRIKNTKTTLRVIAIYQIIGGILGFGMMAWLLLHTNEITGPVLFIFCLAFVLFGFSIQAGNLLLQGSKLKIGLIFSILLQFLQVIAMDLGDYAYEFTSGARAVIGLDFGGEFQFDLGAALSTFSLSINASETEFFIKINIIAFFILAILFDIYEEKFKKPEKVDLFDNEELTSKSNEKRLDSAIEKMKDGESFEKELKEK